MTIRYGLAAVAAWAALAVAATALPSPAPTIAFLVGPPDVAAPLMAELTLELKQSHRFIPGPMLSPLPTASAQPLDAPLEVTLARLRKATKAPWAFVGTVAIGPGPTPLSTLSLGSTVSLVPSAPPKRAFAPVAPRSLELRGRLYDLVLGDVSKELRFYGTESELGAISHQLVAYFRSVRPLKGEVTGMRDAYVLLNLGAQDGVELGTVFQVVPRQVLAPAFPARVRVVDLQAWFCTAEVVSATSSFDTWAVRRKPAPVLNSATSPGNAVPSVFRPGDGVLEDVGYAFIATPKPKSDTAESPPPEQETPEPGEPEESPAP